MPEGWGRRVSGLLLALLATAASLAAERSAFDAALRLHAAAVQRAAGRGVCKDPEIEQGRRR